MNPLKDERTVAMLEFSALRNESAGGKILALLNLLIYEARTTNDNITPVDLPRNQGKIAAWDNLRDLLLRDNPVLSQNILDRLKK